MKNIVGISSTKDKREATKKGLMSMNDDAKDDLLMLYEKQSPDAIGIEDDDGTFYPKKIPVPAIEYVPPAEPHILITDLYENPQDWYHISELINEFAKQSFASYYNGLYFASFTLSTSCLELTLKYELLRNKIIEPSKLEESNYTFGKAIEQIDKLGISKYKSRLDITHTLRNGMFHFNPKKLRESLISIGKELYSPDKMESIPSIIGSMDGSAIEEFQENDFLPDMSYLLDNTEWSKIAFFTYTLMYDITKQLYGKENKIKYVKEGLEDYHRKKNLHS
jgi:hypothetical protein